MGIHLDTQTESLAEYVARRGDWLGRCAYLLSGNREQALDLVQDTLLLAWRATARVEAAADTDAYILRIMLNQHRTQHRRRTLPTLSLEEAGPGGVGPALPDAGDAVGDRQAVGAALKHLPHRQRVVLVLRYWADYDDVQIAEVLDCRRATVRSLAARGMKRIKHHLEAP